MGKRNKKEERKEKTSNTGCSGLATVEIADSTNNIGKEAFDGCSADIVMLEKKEKSEISMTTKKEGKVEIFMAGTGVVNIDWGEATETHVLLPYDKEFSSSLDEKKIKFKYCYNYLAAEERLIKIFGETITHLSCNNNQLESLNVNKNKALKELFCENNELKILDLNKNTQLRELECAYNDLTSLNLRNNTKLTRITCNDNELIKLDIGYNTNLYGLNCSNNKLESLPVRKNTELFRLQCKGNELTSLDISKNLLLEELDCSYNYLTSLNVRKNILLEDLDCSNNDLTSLDVSKNWFLRYLVCSNNDLTNLNVKKKCFLDKLDCSYNLFDADELNKLFKTLPNNLTQIDGLRILKSIIIKGNPGINDCNYRFAEDKKWTVGDTFDRISLHTRNFIRKQKK